MAAPTGAVTVDYQTSDHSDPNALVPCDGSNGTALSRCDNNTAIGKLHFAAGETTKTFTVLITEDSYAEGTETTLITLSNPTGGAVVSNSPANLEITDNDQSPGPNAIDDARNFVRQHYHDFLGREPDVPGWDFWTDNITKCNDPARRPAGQTVEQCILQAAGVDLGGLLPLARVPGHRSFRLRRVQRQSGKNAHLPRIHAGRAAGLGGYRPEQSTVRANH